MMEEPLAVARVVIGIVIPAHIVAIVSGRSVMMIVLDVVQPHLYVIIHVVRHRDVHRTVVEG